MSWPIHRLNRRISSATAVALSTESSFPGATTDAAIATFSLISPAVIGPLSFSATNKLCAMLSAVAVEVLNSGIRSSLLCVLGLCRCRVAKPLYQLWIVLEWLGRQ
ncbi:hypothetical protein D3C71_1982020 [compost metagenome]